MPDPAAHAPETEAKNSRGLGSYVVWGFVVVALYVLSSGPGFRSALRNPKWLAAIRVVYSPLMHAYLHTPLQRPSCEYNSVMNLGASLVVGGWCLEFP